MTDEHRINRIRMARQIIAEQIEAATGKHMRSELCVAEELLHSVQLDMVNSSLYNQEVTIRYVVTSDED